MEPTTLNRPPARALPLRAGPLTLTYEDGVVRYIRLEGREILRRIYAAVRDRNWGTVPGVLREFDALIGKESFRIRFLSEHRRGDIHFDWKGEIAGEPDGALTFAFDGRAGSAFLRNRIGFCVLHPIRECAGQTCRIERTDGAKLDVSFPTGVAAEQPIRGFHDLKAMTHEVMPGWWARVDFEGDLFETEDQRNWIDASYKTFCTPLRLPFPVEIQAGTRIVQRVRLTLRHAGPGDNDARRVGANSKSDTSAQEACGIRALSHPVRISLQRERVAPLPLTGLGSASHGETLTDREVRLLRRLRLSHLQAEVRFDSEDWRTDLIRAGADAEALGCPLELVLHLTGLPADDFRDLARTLARGVLKESDDLPRSFRLGRILAHTNGCVTTSSKSLKAVRNFIREFGLVDQHLPAGGGTSADFYQLNQFRVPADLCDFICWSMNPQVHAFDDASLAETPSAIPAQISTARLIFPDKPLVIAPVTLKPRSNPVATGAPEPTPHGRLPGPVDPRQASLFGAGWTLAAFKHLAESGVASVTFYETTGWRGVMETEQGSPLPDQFRSTPGGVFPLYHVLEWVGEFRNGETMASGSSEPLAVESLVLRQGSRLSVGLANLTDMEQTVDIRDLPEVRSMRHLDEAHAVQAACDPEAFRHREGAAVPASGILRINPHGICWLE